MRAVLIAAVCGALLLAGCGGGAAPTPPPRRGTPVPTPKPTPTPHAVLASCPNPVPLAGLTPLAHFPVAPDDVSPGPAGHLWLSSHDGDRIWELGPDGSVLRTIEDANGPEQVLQLPDGDLAIAEQTPNRVVLRRPDGSQSVLLQLPKPPANVNGVDGMSLDGDHLLVPDGPAGRLLSVPLSGGEPTVLATGLGHPVDAVRLPGGTIAVASESPVGLLEVGPGGSVHAIAALSMVDEVVAQDGLLYVTLLDGHSVEAVDPATGATREIVSGTSKPQGLTSLPDGRLLLVDSAEGVIASFGGCPAA